MRMPNVETHGRASLRFRHHKHRQIFQYNPAINLKFFLTNRIV